MSSTNNNFMRVGTVQHTTDRIVTGKTGKPLFKGHQVLDTATVLDKLPFWYPLVPVIIKDNKYATTGLRYYGYFDIDMNLDQIDCGEESLFTGEEPKKYVTRSLIKDEMKQRLQDALGSTFVDFCATCPALERVRVVTDELAMYLRYVKGVEPVVFFTGGKGTRVLFRDPSLWRQVDLGVSDPGESGRDILEDYLGPELSESLKKIDFDSSVYGRGKGIKTDLLPHPWTGIAPSSMTGTLQQATDDQISHDIREFWTHLINDVPDTAPLLEIKPKYIGKSSKRDRSGGQITVITVPDRVRELMVLAMGDDVSIHRVIKSETHEWIYTVVLSCLHKECEIANRQHSSKGMYYVVNTVTNRVKQKCHVASCLNQEKQVWPRDDISQEQISFFEHNLVQGQYGLAQMFGYVARDDVKVIDCKTGDCYLWCTQKRLWQERSAVSCQNMIVERLMPTLNIITAGISDEKDPKVKLVVSLYKTVTLQATFSQAKTLFYDNEFRGTINNTETHLFPIQGGKVVDLRTGKTFSRLREHRFTFMSPVHYNEDDLSKPTPNADRFFSEVMCADSDMMNFFQKQLGYMLTGEVSDRSMFIWWGHGSNGKGTVSNLVKKIMGEFYVQASKDVMIKSEGPSNKGSATPHLIPLVTARLAVLSETSVDDKIDDAFVKSISGNDPISARPLYGKQFEFIPRTKLVLQTNYKPKFDATDTAVNDRLKLTPFLARFTPTGAGDGEAKQDGNFIQSLMSTHLDEVFRWMLQGSIEWYATKSIVMPNSAQEQMDEYRDDEDVIHQFVTQCCTSYGDTNRAELYTEFKTWCQDNSVKVMSASGFYTALVKKGYKQIKRRGIRFFERLQISV
jgi:P4 family phage/plasmid primase-like protien